MSYGDAEKRGAIRRAYLLLGIIGAIMRRGSNAVVRIAYTTARDMYVAWDQSRIRLVGVAVKENLERSRIGNLCRPCRTEVCLLTELTELRIQLTRTRAPESPIRLERRILREFGTHLCRVATELRPRRVA